MSAVRGSGQEETPRVRGQGRPGEATSHPGPGAVTLGSHPEPEARGSSWEEPPTPEAGREELRLCSGPGLGTDSLWRVEDERKGLVS